MVCLESNVHACREPTKSLDTTSSEIEKQRRRRRNLFERGKAVIAALVVQLRKRSGLLLQQFHQLRGGAAESSRGGGRVPGCGSKKIERLGDKRSKVRVIGTALDTWPGKARLPAGVGDPFVRHRGSQADRQLHPQAVDGNTSIRLLAACLGGTGLNSADKVPDKNARLDFVAMLSTRTTAALAANLTIGQQRFIVPTSRVDGR